jgi:aldehyde dehydrogenase (NAD+)
VVQVVYGDFEVFRRLALTRAFHTVVYTGGEENLEQLRLDTAAQQNVRLVLCSAGKNAAYVKADAAVEKAIDDIVYGCTVDAGQRLQSTGLVFIEEKMFPEFTDKLVEAMKKLPIDFKEGTPSFASHVMGPLCGHSAWERYLRFQGIAYRESKETLRWGKAIETPQGGYFVSPGVHVMEAKKIVSSIYGSNALFGPDLCLVAVQSDEDVQQILNTLPSIHSAALHTAATSVESFSQNLAIPMFLKNKPTTLLNPTLPTAGRMGPNGLNFLYATTYPQVRV